TFSAYAENPRVLVVQLGKKRSFFETLDSAHALRVAIPGAASSFKLDTLKDGLDDFSDCVVGLGGEKIEAPKVAVTIEPAPAVAVEKVTESALIAPHNVQDIPPQPLETIQAEEKPEIIFDEAPQTAEAAPALSWVDETKSFLFGLGLSEQPKQDAAETMVAWELATVNAKAQRMGNIDPLEAATKALDTHEKTCAGTFSSQIGLPETLQGGTFLQMESKCATASDVTVSTWLIEQRENGQVTAWTFTSPREQRAEAFRQRALVQKALAEGGAATYNQASR